MLIGTNKYLFSTLFFLTIVSLLYITSSCTKRVWNPPTVGEVQVSSITSSSAKCFCETKTDGGFSITKMGVCWSLSPNPTISNYIIEDNSGTLQINTYLINLSPGTTYYVRGYASNEIGMSYGTEKSFTTSNNTVTDVDGNVYNTVTIGTQTWMRENLKTTRYRNADLIGTTTPAILDISNSTTYPAPKYQWAYAGNEINVATYGRLYTWHAATDSRNICPTGWHVPTDTEWTTLITFLGGQYVAGGKLKEAGTAHWLSPNAGATNSSGITALPGGSRANDGTFDYVGNVGVWWCSTEYSTIDAMHLNMSYIVSSVSNYNRNKTFGLSVRCLRDM